MSEDRTEADGNSFDPADPPDGQDVEDRPIPELAELRHEPAADIIGGVHRSILRRVFARDLAELSWTTPGVVFVEFLRMLMRIFAPGGALPEEGNDA